MRLSDLERDALTEFMNIGVSRSASSLRKMVDAEVVLSVPAIDIVPENTATRLLEQQGGHRLVGIRQRFEGSISGCSLLILTESKAAEFVRAILGKDMMAEEAAAMEDDTLTEIGNIILSCCLGSIANMVQRSLTMSVPELLRGSASTLLEIAEGCSGDDYVLFVYVNFSIRERDVRGYIAITMDVPSLTALKALIREFIERVLGQDNTQPDPA